MEGKWKMENSISELFKTFSTRPKSRSVTFLAKKNPPGENEKLSTQKR